MILPTKSLERKLFKSGYRVVYAVDEVGMGCLAGPVVVCVVAFNRKFFSKLHRNLHWLRDSKLLLPHQREKFANELMKEKNLNYAISLCSSKTIDKINIYNAARVAMKRAIVALRPAQGYQNYRPIVLIDGKTKIKNLTLEQVAIVKGDRKVFAIACASIIAKVFRDKMMIKYAKKYPGYGFEKHKGYATKYHQEKLAILGHSVIHRQSFRLVYK